MNYEESTGKTIQQAFEEYDKANPLIWEKFKEMAFTAIRRGKTKISFKMMMNVIRWEHFIATEEPADLFTENDEMPKRFKINDAYGSRYARKFVQEFPIHADKIELREIRSL